MSHRDPSVIDLMRELARDSTDVLSEQELIGRFQFRSGPLTPVHRREIASALQQHGLDLGWVALSATLYVPHHVVLDGARLRCQPGPDEVRRGLLGAEHFRPFFSDSQFQQARYYDRVGAPLPVAHGTASAGGDGVLLEGWYRRYRYDAADSVLITIFADRDVIRVQLDHEPAALLRAQDAAEADRELLRSMQQTLNGGELSGRPLRTFLLAGHYLCAGRSAYPGTPPEQLLIQHGLVRDGQVLPSGAVVMTAAEAAAAERRDVVQKIERQVALSQAARQSDLAAGIWDGMFRASVRDRLKRINWQAQLPLDDGGFSPMVEREPPPPTDGVRRRLLAALPAEAAAVAARADGAALVQLLVPFLNHLLQRDRSLFPLLELPPLHERFERLDQFAGDELGSSAHASTQPVADDDLFNSGVLRIGEDGELEEHDDESDFDDAVDLYELARDASYALITDFANDLVERGRVERTITSHVTSLIQLADFLADTFALSIESADYATLDEFLFIYYPAYVAPYRNTTQIAGDIGAICTALRQFYLYLRAEGGREDVRFATAIWRRRHEAAAHVRLVAALRASDTLRDLIPLLFAAYER